jgi:hypothetical protein
VPTARFIPAPRQGDAQVVVLAVELFAEATVVVLATTAWDELVAAGFFDGEKPALRIEDDVGTEYRRLLQNFSGYVSERTWEHSRGVHRMNPAFEPAVPAEASRLRIALGRWGSVVVMV